MKRDVGQGRPRKRPKAIAWKGNASVFEQGLGAQPKRGRMPRTQHRRRVVARFLGRLELKSRKTGLIKGLQHGLWQLSGLRQRRVLPVSGLPIEAGQRMQAGQARHMQAARGVKGPALKSQGQLGDRMIGHREQHKAVRPRRVGQGRQLKSRSQGPPQATSTQNGKRRHHAAILADRAGLCQFAAMAYQVLSAPHEAELIVNRSRFICHLERVASIEAAQAVIQVERERFPDATHHCYAFVVGPAGSTARVGQSDDGEPHGVAGRPMLNILLHSGVGEVACVVTRYFGGIKLGRGGMLRAYSQSVKDALETAPLEAFRELDTVELQVSYALAESLKRLYPDFEAELIDEQFAAEVRHSLRLPAAQRSGLDVAIRDLSKGQLALPGDPSDPADSEEPSDA